MSDLIFRAATEDDMSSLKRPMGGMYRPVVLAARDGPQVIEWVGRRDSLVKGVHRAAEANGMRVTMQKIDRTHFLVSEVK